jgi:3-oxoacyl-[acyl-carrier protein] reductase
MVDLSGRVALVTGGSRGIGWACAEALCAAGAACALTWRETEETARDSVRLLREKGAQAEAVQLDLRSPESVRAAMETVLDLLGRVDILVNNAGIWNAEPVAARDLDEAAMTEMIEVNLVGVMRVTRAALRDMGTRRYGRIITIGSTAGVRGEPGHAHYAATKGALLAWTRSLAVEVGPLGITANVVSPGWVFTDMTRGVLTPAFLRGLEDAIPTRRITRPDDVAQAVLFLASREAEQVNGANLDVNGGAVFS